MKKGKLSKAASLLLSLMLVLTLIPAVDTDTAWAEDTSETTETQPSITFRVCDRTIGVTANNTLRTVKPGQCLTKDCEVKDTNDGIEYIASFASNGKTLLLNNYDRGAIIVRGTDELTIQLKGNNTIKQFIDYGESEKVIALNGSLLNGTSSNENLVDLTITSADSSSKGSLTLEDEKGCTTDGYGNNNAIYGITAKSLNLDGVELELNLKNGETRETCIALSIRNGMTVKNSIVNINISDISYTSAKAYGLYTQGGMLSIDESTVDVKFQNCTTNDGRGKLYAIANMGNDGDVSIDDSTVNINAENDELSESYHKEKIGIYTNSSVEAYGKIKISGSSQLTIDGGKNKFGYGILDKSGENEDNWNCAGVIAEGSSTLNISNAIYGISSYRRGVDMKDSTNVTVDADDTAIYGYLYTNNYVNTGKYGLHVSGNSNVTLKAQKNAVAVYQGLNAANAWTEGLIDLAKDGSLSMSITRNAEDTDDTAMGKVVADPFRLGSNTAITIGKIWKHSDNSHELYTAKSAEPTTLEDGRKEYKIEFKGHDGDILEVNWNQRTNKVSWSDTSLLTRYELVLEGAENNGSSEPEYKEIAVIAEKYEGKSYTLTKDITDMMIPTMNYRIKVTPYTANTDWHTIESMASYSNIKQATESVGTLDLTKTGYWQIGWNAHEKAQKYYYDVKKYDEETKEYKSVYKSYEVKIDDRKQEVYDLRDALVRGEEWCVPGKYILSVTANVGNDSNVLARGESTEAIVFKYNTLSGSTDEALNAKFTTKVSRNSARNAQTWINGDDNDSNDFDPTKLLYGDKVPLAYKQAEGTAEIMNGWYVKSNIINMKTTEGTDSDGNKTLSFTMPLNNDVTAYPLIGTEEISEATLEYDRSYSDNISKDRLVMLARRFENADFFKDYFSSISITWTDENRNSVGALSELIDNTKNYVGTVKLTPASGKYFAEDMKVMLYDIIDEDNNEERYEYITNGEVKDGCYYFDIYLINMPKITIPFVDDVLEPDEAKAELVNNQKLYTAYAGEVKTGDDGSGTIDNAWVTSGLMNVLFADTPQLMVNGNVYSAELSFGDDGEATVTATTKIKIYPTPAAPILNYPSGTMFYADSSTETEINVVKLSTDYLAELQNPAAKINYSYKTSDSNSTVSGSVARNEAITFKMKGSTNVATPTSVTLTVWVDNGPKTSYTYYAVDAFASGSSSSVYMPILTPGSTSFTSTSLQLKLVNPLPNLKYCYIITDTGYTLTDEPDNWSDWLTYKEYGDTETASINITDTGTVHIAGYGTKPDKTTDYTKAASGTYTKDATTGYTLKGTITSQGSASDPITIKLKQGDETVDEQTVYGSSAAYSFRLTQPGTYSLEVSKKKHKTYTASVGLDNDSPTKVANVPLEYVSISGTVISAGDDNDDVTITLTGNYYSTYSGKASPFAETISGKGYSLAYCFDDNRIATNLKNVDADSEFAYCNCYTIEVKKAGHEIQTKTVDLNTVDVPYTWDVNLEQTSVKLSGEISFSDIEDISEAVSIPRVAVNFRENSTGDSKDASVSFAGTDMQYIEQDFLKRDTEYTMTVKSDGYLTHTEVLHTDTKPMTKDIKLIKAASDEEDTFAVSGKIITKGGRIDDAVEIALIPEGSTEAKYSQTVNDTEYIFTAVEQGTYTLTAKKLGFKDNSEAVNVKYEAVSCDIQLDPVKISGTVKTDDNSKEITLTLTKDGETSPKYSKTISAADFTADGDKYTAEYRFGGDEGTEVVEPGTYNLTATQAAAAEGEDPVSSTAKNLIVAYNDLTQNLDLTKPAGVTVSGSIISWDNVKDNAVIKLYADSSKLTDAVIRADMRTETRSKAVSGTETVLGDKLEAGAKAGTYKQSFTLSAELADGTYKLAVYKPKRDGKDPYVVRVVKVTVSGGAATIDGGSDVKLWLYGDVNDDGSVNAKDDGQASRCGVALSSLVKKDHETVYESHRFIAADVNGDGEVDVKDAGQMSRRGVGLLSLLDNFDN